MIEILVIFTLFCLLVPVYVYAGYPLLLWLMTRGENKVRPHTDALPSVTLIISCYNEVDVIEDKLKNSLALDYPETDLSILVVSDGSDDGTDDVVKQYEERGVTLVRQEGRLGKTMGLNLAMEQVSSDIVIFSDANAIYAEDAIRKLVRNFSDDTIGYVVGAALYTDGEASGSAHNEGLYWRYELAIKAMESKLYSVVGGDGAIYAIRKDLWEPLQNRDINDFVNPLQIIAKGYRGVFDGEARCYEETAGSFDKEIARKERIVNRSIHGLIRVKEVLNPVNFGVFSFEVISHKLLRWLIPLFLLLGIIAGCILATLGYKLFELIVAGALLLTLLATIGHVRSANETMPAIISMPYYFIMVNAFAIRGVLKALQGETQITWNSARLDTSQNKQQSGQQQLLWFLLALIVMTTSLLVNIG